jgi:hypothetical protein
MPIDPLMNAALALPADSPIASTAAPTAVLHVLNIFALL